MELLSYINSFSNIPTIISIKDSDITDYNHTLDSRHGYFTAVNASDLRVGTTINRNGNVYSDSISGSISLDELPSLSYEPLTVPDSISTVSSGTLTFAEPIRMAPSVTEEFRNEILQSINDAIRDACNQYIGRPNNQVTASSIAAEVARMLHSEVAATTENNSDGTATLSIQLPDIVDDVRMNINISSETYNSS